MFNIRRVICILYLALSVLTSGAVVYRQPSPEAQEKLKPFVQPAKENAQKKKITEEEQRYTQEREFIKKLSLRKKIGQLLMIGFMGTEINRGLGKAIESIGPGGVIFFGRNIRTPRQLATLTFEAQKVSYSKSHIPLFVAVDQEGGNVIRIKTSPPLPSAMALGETQNIEIVNEAGLRTGQLLKALGFNMNLAPVLDVSDPDSESFIGNRAFGKDATAVSKMGFQFAKGLIAGGVLPTAKHFPGHGGIRGDSHKETPSKDASLETLWDTDLAPFRFLAQGLPSVAMMVAHISYPKIDPTRIPATFSKIMITQVLREKMAFDGLVLTDDIEMGGAFAIHDAKERAIRAIEAGVDLIMVAWNRPIQERVVSGLEQAVKNGRISEARIDQSVLRIIHNKRKFVRFVPPKEITETVLLTALRDPGLKKLADATLQSRVDASMQNFDPEIREDLKKRPGLVFAAPGKFYDSFKAGATGHALRFVSLSSQRASEINRVMRANPRAFGIFYLSGGQSARLLNGVADDVAKRMVIIDSETPGLIRKPSLFKNQIDAFFRHPDLGRVAARALYPPETLPTEARRPAAGSSARMTPPSTSSGP